MTGANMGPDLTSWTFWWGFNREKYLQLKAKISKDDGVITPAGGGDDILGNATAGRTSLRPSQDQITKDVIPALKEALEKETNRDIISGALVALAKIGQEPDDCIKVFKKFFDNSDQEIAETSVLVLGILAAQEGLPILEKFYTDHEDARKWCGKREVPWRTRTFAAYGIGLTGARCPDVSAREKAQAILLTFLSPNGQGYQRASQKDLRVATVISLGLIADPERKAVQTLQKYFEANREKEELICAHVPNAMARLLATAPMNERGAYVQMCIAELAEKGKSKDKEIRSSMAQAIGMLTRADDASIAPKAFDVLQDKIDNEMSKNPHLANYGIIALGQIAGTDKQGSKIEKYLLTKAQASGGKVMTRAWAAIALGVAGFHQMNREDDKQLEPNKTVGEALTNMMSTEIKDPEQLAAYAIGLGLLRYAPASGQLKAKLSSVKDDSFRGYFATALGLMDDKTAIDPIREIVKTAKRRPELIRECSIALGLLGDKTVVKELLAILGDKENNTLAVQAAVATALGYVGDYRSVDPKNEPTNLVRMLADAKKELTMESRAFAAVAMGIVCDKEEFPWNFKVSTDINYMAVVGTLNDYTNQTGLLNLL
ncbi:MAG: HEAT repeat domain-containing protein [Planctomycetota bacterium]